VLVLEREMSKFWGDPLPMRSSMHGFASTRFTPFEANFIMNLTELTKLRGPITGGLKALRTKRL
jgi:hypothetical protein